MAPDDELFARNRVILCHFDGYSTALVFARWSDTQSLLLLGPLPEGAQPMPAPAQVPAGHEVGPILQAVIEHLALPAEVALVPVPEFNEWQQTPAGPLRVHLLRFDTFEAPGAVLTPFESVFKPISELRGSAMPELLLLRQVFNLIVGGGAGRT
jgi:hypothetical protein